MVATAQSKKNRHKRPSTKRHATKHGEVERGLTIQRKCQKQMASEGKTTDSNGNSPVSLSKECNKSPTPETTAVRTKEVEGAANVSVVTGTRTGG